MRIVVRCDFRRDLQLERFQPLALQRIGAHSQLPEHMDRSSPVEPAHQFLHLAGLQGFAIVHLPESEGHRIKLLGRLTGCFRLVGFRLFPLARFLLGRNLAEARFAGSIASCELLFELRDLLEHEVPLDPWRTGVPVLAQLDTGSHHDRGHSI